MESALASLSGFQQGPAGQRPAIVENKRLGHALALVKAQQDLKYQPQVKTNSGKIGYKNRGRTIYGPPPEQAAVEMTV